MKTNLLIVGLLGIAFCAFGQSPATTTSYFDFLQKENENEGKIIIHQDSALIRTFEKQITIHLLDPTVDGYRIQIFSGSGMEARDKINVIRGEFITAFPEFDVNKIYPLYQPPFFKVRVGDFRSKSEALPVYKKIVKKFPQAYVFKEKINDNCIAL